MRKALYENRYVRKMHQRIHIILYSCISMRKMYRIQLNANFDIPNFKVGLLQSIKNMY